MAVPRFVEFTRPLLEVVSDGKEYRLADCYEPLATQLELSDDDRKEMLPSGTKTRFQDRAQWAVTYLRKARCLRSTRRGHFTITERGQEALRSAARIDIDYLSQFPEIVEFRSSKGKIDSDTGGPNRESVADVTPEEQLEQISEDLTDTLASDLLDAMRECSPQFFEQLVIEVLLKMGYGGSRKDAGKAVGRSGDGGVDGVINEDRLGLDRVYVQAKRYKDKNSVGRPAVQAFVGSIEAFRSRKGILITTSDFTTDAVSFVDRLEKRIILINGTQLARYMIEYGVGVTVDRTYVINRIDADYFE